ncbi:MAG: Gfo/Idh/MocA family oxidoreductase [Anaerolineae bacterium]
MERLQRKLRFGQIGGGNGSFIGHVHRRAALFDGLTEFAAGALSSTAERSYESGADLLLPAERNYGDWREMLAAELGQPEDERLDYVCICTPNDAHFEPALAFIEAGFNVIMDKPLVHTSEQAAKLVAAVEQTGVTFGITYNYTGYPMIKEAREWVRSGRLGTLRRVVVEYPQGWLGERLEAEGHKQASWRTDPARTGIAGAVGDIGTHCESLMHYVTGLEIEALCAEVSTFVEGRAVDDDASVLLRLSNGATGILWVSQVCTGEGNGLNIRVYGTEGSLHWNQENPFELVHRAASGPVQIFRRGDSATARRGSRLPAGLEEAYFEAFANIYMNYSDTIRARLLGREPTALELDFPTVYDGARGVRFIERVIESGRQGAAWTNF